QLLMEKMHDNEMMKTEMKARMKKMMEENPGMMEEMMQKMMEKNPGMKEKMKEKMKNKKQ
ncbi:MAG: hypothetical protein KJN85_13635, partial [Maribacter sp.]|nr:hypothetical protein [Maribacter sp.]